MTGPNLVLRPTASRAESNAELAIVGDSFHSEEQVDPCPDVGVTAIAVRDVEAHAGPSELAADDVHARRDGFPTEQAVAAARRRRDVGRAPGLCGRLECDGHCKNENLDQCPHRSPLARPRTMHARSVTKKVRGSDDREPVPGYVAVRDEDAAPEA